MRFLCENGVEYEEIDLYRFHLDFNILFRKYRLFCFWQEYFSIYLLAFFSHLGIFYDFRFTKIKSNIFRL